MPVAPVAPRRPLTAERAQAVPLLLVVLALAMGGALLLVEVVHVAGDEARAQAAADAAALAGAAQGPEAAAALAAANGADLLGVDTRGPTFEARVARGRATARATAEAVGAGAGSHPELAPAMQAAVARLEQLLGAPLPVTAPVDGSPLHAHGLAVDVPGELVDAVLAVAGEAGLCQQLPQDHPVHFEPCPPTRS